MDAQCISNTTRVCLKALEKHFFLLPPCAVVATSVAFLEKGNFSWPFLGFHIYFKIPIVSLTQKNGRSPWLGLFCCSVCNISYRRLSAHGAAGAPVAWLG